MSGYRLGIKCCFCGGSLEIDEASRTTRCSHCGSVLKIAREGTVRGYYVDDDTPKREVKFLIDRHLKKSGESLVSRWGEMSKKYLPFWRINAVVFSTYERMTGTSIEYDEFRLEPTEESSRTEVKIVPKEISFCANDTFAWGIESLGIRTQVLKLEPLDSEFYETNDPVPLTVDSEQATGRFDKAIQSTASAVSQSGTNIDVTGIMPETMLIYFPVWVAEFTNRSGRHVAQLDPLAKRVASITDGEIEIPRSSTPPSFKSDPVKIMPHRCPNCGCDLPQCERSVTYYCANCKRLFMAEGMSYKQLRAKIPSDIEGEHQLFPFWVFDLSASFAGSDADEFDQALGLIGFSHEKFYVPAFNIVNPSRMLRLVSHYNKRNDTFAFEKHPTNDYTFADVTLTPEHAASMIVPLTVATKTMKGFKSYEASVSGQADVGDPDLVWLPYALDRYFWREQITGAAIEKAAVKV